MKPIFIACGRVAAILALALFASIISYYRGFDNGRVRGLEEAEARAAEAQAEAEARWKAQPRVRLGGDNGEASRPPPRGGF